MAPSVIRLNLQGIELAFCSQAQTVIVRDRRSRYFGDGSEARISWSERQVAKRCRVISVKSRVLARLMNAVITDVVECDTALRSQWLLNLHIPLLVLRGDNAVGSIVEGG